MFLTIEPIPWQRLDIEFFTFRFNAGIIAFFSIDLLLRMAIEVWQLWQGTCRRQLFPSTPDSGVTGMLTRPDRFEGGIIWLAPADIKLSGIRATECSHRNCWTNFQVRPYGNAVFYQICCLHELVLDSLVAVHAWSQTDCHWSRRHLPLQGMLKSHDM